MPRPIRGFQVRALGGLACPRRKAKARGNWAGRIIRVEELLPVFLSLRVSIGNTARWLPGHNKSGQLETCQHFEGRRAELTKSERRLVKVRFYDPVVGYENIWAIPLEDGTYRLGNPPFFIYGVAMNDVVAAMPDEHGALQFLNVLRRSGHKTLRARSKLLHGDQGFRNRTKQELRQMGCEVEEHRERLLAISVPPTATLDQITSYLTANQLSWEYGYPSELNK
jgi:Domain of unknown function (DUF4265)